MIKKINSTVIGPLIQDESLTDWWNGEQISVPFFDNRKLRVSFINFNPNEDPDFVKDADSALTNFLSKTASDRLSISSLVYRNCMDFLEDIGYDEADQPLWDIKDEKDIWDFVYPKILYVSRRAYNEKDIYLQISWDCEWEQEHGLQLIFRQGKKITRVSAEDGHLTEADAYDKSDDEDELLSKF